MASPSSSNNPTIIPSLLPTAPTMSIPDSCHYLDALDIVILVSKSCGLTSNICSDHQNFIAEIFSCLKYDNDNPRIAYIEFDQHVHVRHSLMDNYKFNLDDFYTLHDLIRYSECNMIPNDITDLVSAFQSAIDEFSIGLSDILHRKKKVVIFSCAQSNIDNICDIFGNTVVTENIDVVAVNTPYRQSIDDGLNYLKCLTKHQQKIHFIDPSGLTYPFIVHRNAVKICYDLCALTQPPSSNPTANPTNKPTQYDTISPSRSPTYMSILSPTNKPTQHPTSLSPTFHPSDEPTNNPSVTPSFPTSTPSISPTKSPSFTLTLNPTMLPTGNCKQYLIT